MKVLLGKYGVNISGRMAISPIETVRLASDAALLHPYPISENISLEVSLSILSIKDTEIGVAPIEARSFTFIFTISSPRDEYLFAH